MTLCAAVCLTALVIAGPPKGPPPASPSPVSPAPPAPQRPGAGAPRSPTTPAPLDGSGEVCVALSRCLTRAACIIKSPALGRCPVTSEGEEGFCPGWPGVFCWGTRLHLSQGPFAPHGARHRACAVERYPEASVDVSGCALLTFVHSVYVSPGLRRGRSLCPSENAKDYIGLALLCPRGHGFALGSTQASFPSALLCRRCIPGLG